MVNRMNRRDNMLSLRKSIIRSTELLYAAGLNTTYSGNVSIRAGDSAMLITPGSMDKTSLSPKDISLFDFRTDTLVSGPKQSSEYKMHSSTYSATNTKSVVHAHPPYSVAVYDSLGRKAYSGIGDKEAAYYIGKLGFVGRYNPGSERLASAVSSEFRNGACTVIMQGHGTVAVGREIAEARGRVEYLEYISKRIYIRQMLM